MTATTSKLGADMTEEQIQALWQRINNEFICTTALNKTPVVIAFARALLARQPAAIGKEPLFYADDEQIADWEQGKRGAVDVRVTSIALGSCNTPLYAAPLDKEASKPAAPSVEQDERGAVIATVRTDPPITGVTTGPWTRLFVADVEIDRSGDPTELVKKAEQINHSYAHQSRAASTSANVAQGAEAVEGWESIRVKNFLPFVEAVERAIDKGYLPDAMMAEWVAFEFSTEPQPAQTALTDDARDAIRRAALEEAIQIIETHRVPVGNSPAGEMAAGWTMDALHEIRDAIRALSQKEA